MISVCWLYSLHYELRFEIITLVESAKASVQQISRVFTGNLILNDETGAWSIDKSGNPPPYFEEPSSAVEDAWTELLRGKLQRMHQLASYAHPSTC